MMILCFAFLQVKANSLEANEVYTFQVIAVLNGDNKLTGTTSVTVTTGVSGVVAIINGGNEFTSSPQVLYLRDIFIVRCYE